MPKTTIDHQFEVGDKVVPKRGYNPKRGEGVVVNITAEGAQYMNLWYTVRFGTEWGTERFYESELTAAPTAKEVVK